MKAYLRAERVSGGLFSGEREVTVKIGDRTVRFMCDESFVAGDFVEVTEIEDDDTTQMAMIELPGEPWSSTRRQIVPWTEIVFR